MLALEMELLNDLTEELSEADEKFNQKLLIPKLRGAIREVRHARRYPKHYTDGMVAEDMQSYYSNIRNIALYDYNLIGAEGQVSNGETGSSRVFLDRRTLFNGIIPLSKV